MQRARKIINSLSHRIKNAFRPFKRIRNEIRQIRNDTKGIRIDNHSIQNVAKAIAFERFYDNQNANYLANFGKNHFVLFNYPYHFLHACGNLGDEIQSIATKNAIDSIVPNASYEYFCRDTLAYYNANKSQIVNNNIGGGQ